MFSTTISCLKPPAVQYNYSEFRLAQKFKAETGVPVSRYIKERRIRRAMQLLDNTRDSIQEIGEHLSFCNTSYFVETFRAVVGTTPGEYRDRAAENRG